MSTRAESAILIGHIASFHQADTLSSARRLRSSCFLPIRVHDPQPETRLNCSLTPFRRLRYLSVFSKNGHILTTGPLHANGPHTTTISMTPVGSLSPGSTDDVSSPNIPKPWHGSACLPRTAPCQLAIPGLRTTFVLRVLYYQRLTLVISHSYYSTELRILPGGKRLIYTKRHSAIY
jgi:hypothetical protein